MQTIAPIKSAYSNHVLFDSVLSGMMGCVNLSSLYAPLPVLNATSGDLLFDVPSGIENYPLSSSSDLSAKYTITYHESGSGPTQDDMLNQLSSDYTNKSFLKELRDDLVSSFCDYDEETVCVPISSLLSSVHNSIDDPERLWRLQIGTRSDSLDSVAAIGKFDSNGDPIYPSGKIAMVFRQMTLNARTASQGVAGGWWKFFPFIVQIVPLLQHKNASNHNTKNAHEYAQHFRTDIVSSRRYGRSLGGIYQRPTSDWYDTPWSAPLSYMKRQFVERQTMPNWVGNAQDWNNRWFNLINEGPVICNQYRVSRNFNMPKWLLDGQETDYDFSIFAALEPAPIYDENYLHFNSSNFDGSFFSHYFDAISVDFALNRYNSRIQENLYFMDGELLSGYYSIKIGYDTTSGYIT